MTMDDETTRLSENANAKEVALKAMHAMANDRPDLPPERHVEIASGMGLVVAMDQLVEAVNANTIATDAAGRSADRYAKILTCLALLAIVVAVISVFL